MKKYSRQEIESGVREIIAKCMQLETDEVKLDDLITRAWLVKHGWEPTKNIPLFQHDPEYIDADLCVIVDRKDYMVAKFHYMGDRAFDPMARPDSFVLIGVNNNAELLEYDHHRLVMAAYVCHLTIFEQINKALGGKFDITMKHFVKEEVEDKKDKILKIDYD